MNMFDALNVIFVGICSTVPYGSGSHFNFRKSQEQVKNRSTKCQEQGGIKSRKIKNCKTEEQVRGGGWLGGRKIKSKLKLEALNVMSNGKSRVEKSTAAKLKSKLSYCPYVSLYSTIL